MEEFIKQFKRDLILYANDYWDLEKETQEPIYMCENLIYERGNIIYSFQNLEGHSVGIICDSKESFLKSDIEDIIHKCNEIIYYNFEGEE